MRALPRPRSQCRSCAAAPPAWPLTHSKHTSGAVPPVPDPLPPAHPWNAIGNELQTSTKPTRCAVPCSSGSMNARLPWGLAAVRCVCIPTALRRLQPSRAGNLSLPSRFAPCGLGALPSHAVFLLFLLQIDWKPYYDNGNGYKDREAYVRGARPLGPGPGPAEGPILRASGSWSSS